MKKKLETDYQAIIAQLEDIRSHAISMAAEGNEVWCRDAQALDEAVSIIQDYARNEEL